MRQSYQRLDGQRKWFGEYRDRHLCADDGRPVEPPWWLRQLSHVQNLEPTQASRGRPQGESATSSFGYLWPSLWTVHRPDGGTTTGARTVWWRPSTRAAADTATGSASGQRLRVAERRLNIGRYLAAGFHYRNGGNYRTWRVEDVRSSGHAGEQDELPSTDIATTVQAGTVLTGTTDELMRLREGHGGWVRKRQGPPGPTISKGSRREQAQGRHGGRRVGAVTLFDEIVNFTHSGGLHNERRHPTS
jgi:hypothetical protein